MDKTRNQKRKNKYYNYPTMIRKKNISILGHINECLKINGITINIDNQLKKY